MLEALKENPPRVGPDAIAATTWTLFAIALISYVGRMAVRWNASHRLYLDDAWATGAFIILLALCIVITLAVPPMEDILKVAAGIEEPSANFDSNGTYYLKLQFAFSILFWTCLWCVKGCFLSFFFHLTDKLKWSRWAWWGIVVFTASSYIGSVITLPVACSSFNLGDCSSSTDVDRSWASLRFSTAVDIISDIMILPLALYLAIRMRVSMCQQVALGGAFSFAVIIIIFAGVRLAVTNANGRQVDPSWSNLWAQIEASLAVIISCLPPFKSFFTRGRLRSLESGILPSREEPSWQKGHRHNASDAPAPIKEGETLSYEFQPDGTVGLEPRETDFMDRILGTTQIDIKAMKKPLQPRELDIQKMERRLSRASTEMKEEGAGAGTGFIAR